MLNKSALIQAINSIKPLLATRDTSTEKELYLQTHRTDICQYPLDSVAKPYSITAIDGSQIYYDRTQDISCALINIGTVYFEYHHTQPSVFIPLSQPFIIVPDKKIPLYALSPDYINSTRQDYELAQAVHYCTQHTRPNLVLFDGSLIFWHLNVYVRSYKDYFFSRYCTHLTALHEKDITYATYISSPRFAELAPQMLNLSYILNPGCRTAVFASTNALCAEYPDHSKPYFFYIHTGSEIGRVEIPAFIAHDNNRVTALANLIFDQCRKGNGYPIALAEAHEQAVIKEEDRTLFFYYLERMRVENSIRIHQPIKQKRKDYARV